MIASKLAKTILNELFHTGGSASSVTAEEEKNNLMAEGVSWGVSAELYALAFDKDGYKINGPTTQKYDQYRARIKQTEWWMSSTKNTESILHEYKDPKTGKQYTVAITGWDVGEPSSKPDIVYPQKSFLALFTQMPDDNGQGYIEPQYTEGGDATNYMRVNLHEGVITGEKSLNMPFKDEITGESVIDNKEIIAYPEVEGVSWGNIVGFGVFETEDVMSGTPVFWGTMNNIEAIINRVPLFRVGNFKVTLQ